jgi:hypothetical protein
MALEDTGRKAHLLSTRKLQIIPNFDVNLLQPFCDDDAFNGIFLYLNSSNFKLIFVNFCLYMSFILNKT